MLELGHADTLALRASRGQATADQSQLPAPTGSLLHCILTNPDNVSLEFLTPDVFAVSVVKILTMASFYQNLFDFVAEGDKACQKVSN